MKWSFSPNWSFSWGKKRSSLPGRVGVSETPTSISVAYGFPAGTDMLIQAYTFQTVKNLVEKQAVLTQFVNTNHLEGGDCSYVLTGGDYSLNLVDAPAVAKGEVIPALRWVLRDLINFPIEEAVIDTFDVPFPRARDNTKMIYAAVMRKPLIAQVETLIRPSGLNLKVIDIPELALKNIINRYPTALKGCAFIQLGQKVGKLILYRENELCMTRSFDLKLEDLGVDLERDRRVLESLALEIQRSFDYLNSVFGHKIQNIIVLAPTLINHAIIQESLKNSLGLEVIFLKLSEFLTFDKPMNENEESNCLLAVGALLREEAPLV